MAAPSYSFRFRVAARALSRDRRGLANLTFTIRIPRQPLRANHTLSPTRDVPPRSNAHTKIRPLWISLARSFMFGSCSRERGEQDGPTRRGSISLTDKGLGLRERFRRRAIHEPQELARSRADSLTGKRVGRGRGVEHGGERRRLVRQIGRASCRERV